MVLRAFGRSAPALGLGAAGVGVLWVLALSGCSAFDESLLSRAPMPRQAGGSSGGAGDAAQSQPDAAVRPPGDGGRLDTLREDAGAAHDAGRAPVPPAHDGGRDGGGLTDSAVPDSGPPLCVPTTTDDYCSHIHGLPAAAVIDGQLDCGPELRALAPVGWNGSGSLPAAPTTSVAAAWRADGLYVYVEVRGKTAAPHPSGSAIQCGDAVEIYVDQDGNVNTGTGNYDTPGAMQFVIAAPAPSAPGTIEAQRFVESNHKGAWTSANVRTALLSDGYAVEAFITAADLDLTAWALSGQIGFDVAIDVAGTPNRSSCAGGMQLGQYFLREGAAGGSCNGEPWCDSRAFCTPQL